MNGKKLYFLPVLDRVLDRCCYKSDLNQASDLSNGHVRIMDNNREEICIFFILSCNKYIFMFVKVKLLQLESIWQVYLSFLS